MALHLLCCLPPILSTEERLLLCMKGLEVATENSSLLYSSLWTSAKHEITPQGDIFSAGWCFQMIKCDQEDLVCKRTAYWTFEVVTIPSDRPMWMVLIPGVQGEKFCSSCPDLGWNLIRLFPNAWNLPVGWQWPCPLVELSEPWSKQDLAPFSGSSLSLVTQVRESHSSVWTI